MHLEPPFPAQEEWLVGWITSLITRHLQPSTIRGYLTAVRSHHVDLRFNTSVFNSEHLKRFLQGVNHLLPTSIPSQLRRAGDAGYRKPLLQPDLFTMLDTLPEESTAQLGVKVALALAWTGGLRVGEFTYETKHLRLGSSFGRFFITRQALTFYPDGLRLLVPSSKTSYLKPIEVWIAKPHLLSHQRRYCPIGLALKYFTQDASRPLTDPLFFAPGLRPFTRNYIVEILRQFDPSYNGYSFRRGIATWASRVGFNVEEIKQLGRWTSDSVLRYIETTPSQHLSLSHRLQTGTPSGSSSLPPISRPETDQIGAQTTATPSSQVAWSRPSPGSHRTGFRPY